VYRWFSEFLVVHNGIITNYNDVKGYLVKKGYTFESETDTEVIAKLIQHLHDRYPKFSFRQLVETTIQQLVGCTIESPYIPFSDVTQQRCSGGRLRIGLQEQAFPWSASGDSAWISPAHRNQERVAADYRPFPCPV
jgi:glucosamine--fructose-6-phosphate aminotransferase (isomerizing)